MADRKDDPTERSPRPDRANDDDAMHENDTNNEWLRDQTGEDHNLSGSSTYRTLPDQPGTGSNTKDRDDDRESNR